MDEIRKQERNYEGSNEENQNDMENEEYKNDTTSITQKMKESESNYRPKKNKINSISQGNTHSRSRSPRTTKNSKQWKSSNPFIHFVQDFRQNYIGKTSTRIYKLAGERWRNMSSEEKQPYVKAAINVKNRKGNHQDIQNINKPDITTEKTKKGNTQKQQPIKKSRKQRAAKKTPKKRRNAESDTDSFTSDTAGTNTSEDLSDVSS